MSVVCVCVNINVNLFFLLDDGAHLLDLKSLQALSILAASEDADLQMGAALYYLHLGHHCELRKQTDFYGSSFNLTVTLQVSGA